VAAVPASLPAPRFDLFPEHQPTRTSVYPILAGVAAGLVIGLALGYWLGAGSAGTRPAPGGTPTSARGSTAPPSVPPAAVPSSQAAAPVPESAAQAVAQPGQATPPVADAPVSPPPGAAEAAPKPVPPPGPAVGEITVRATPLSANVFLDGQRDGLTPRNLHRVPLGTHTIRVTRPAYATQEREVVLTAREPSAVVEFTLRPGEAGAPVRPAPSSKAPARPAVPPTAAGGRPSTPTPAVVVPSLVIVTRPPGARVRVDGHDVGVTPLTVTPLQPGPHSVELQLQGYRRWASAITLAAGERRRLTASLERESIR